MEQLERFNRLGLGRELRLLEIKQEVSEMVRKAGVALPYKSSDRRRPAGVASTASESSTPVERQE